MEKKHYTNNCPFIHSKNSDKALKGLALLGLNDPGQAIAQSDEWVFNPHEECEVLGDLDKVVLPRERILDRDSIRHTMVVRICIWPSLHPAFSNY